MCREKQNTPTNTPTNIPTQNQFTNFELEKIEELGFIIRENAPLSTISSKDLAEVILDAGYRKQSEGEWIAKHLMSRSSRGRYTSYNTYTCNVCGKENGRRKTPFCPNCGAPTKETKATCPKCGKEVASGAKFCANCGNAL